MLIYIFLLFTDYLVGNNNKDKKYKILVSILNLVCAKCQIFDTSQKQTECELWDASVRLENQTFRISPE